MTTILRPKVTLNILPAALEISVAPQRMLFIGQKLSSGTAPSGTLQEDIRNDNSENSLFGQKSMLACMIRAAKVINKVTRVDAIGFDDAGSAVKAAGAIAFTGPATENGTLYITVGSSQNYKYALDIESGDTATVIGAKLEALINGDLTAVVDAVNTTGSVALQAVNAGLEGNQIGLRVEGKVLGVTVALTAMNGGLTNPTISVSTLEALIGNQRYQTIVWPSSYNVDTIVDFLEARFNPTNEVLDGVAIVTKTDSFANLSTYANNLNSKCLVVFGNKLINDSDFKGPSMLEMNNIISSEFAAIRAMRLTQDANISQYVIATRGALDSYGGAALASLPYHNTPMYQLPIVPTGKGFSKEDIDDLTDAGISIIGNNVTKTQVIVADVVTTYKTDVAGNPDKSFKYLNYVDTITTIREYMVNNARARFAQCRLTAGDLVANRSIANEVVVRAFFIQCYQNLSGQDYVLTQAGEDNLRFFKDNLRVSLNIEDGQVTANMVTPIVTQLREILGTIQIAFSTESIQ